MSCISESSSVQAVSLLGVLSDMALDFYSFLVKGECCPLKRVLAEALYF